MFLLLAIQQPVKASRIISLFPGITVADTLSLSLTQTNISCYAGINGNITANVSGGQAPYQYSKDRGASWQRAAHFEDLAAGAYTIYVKDDKGLLDSAAATLTEPLPLAVSTTLHPVSCYDNNNGSIVLLTSGGTPPYQYSRDKGTNWQHDPQFAALPGGDYLLYIRDQAGCVISTEVTVAIPSPLTMRLTSQHVTCSGGNNGRITVTAEGGTRPYQYSKDNGATWEDAALFTALTEGDYTILTKDHNSCVTSASVVIGAPLPLSIHTQNNDITCNGLCNGSINITAEGGTPPYKYSNNNGLSWQLTPGFRDISAGIYPLMVKDNNGCVVQEKAQLKEPARLNLRSGHATLNGPSDFSLTMTGSGGTFPYAYSIDRGSNWQDSATFQHVQPGAYSVLIKDGNGCGGGVIVTLTVSSPLQIIIDSWGASCYGAANGNFIVKPQHGRPPYKYSINDGKTWQQQNIFKGRAGTYTILVEDQDGKRGAAKVLLGEPSLLTTSVQSTAVSCYKAADGIITSLAIGGAAPYKYSINNGANWQSKAGFEGLPGGNYTLLVRDINGCGAGAPVKLHEPALLDAGAQNTSVTCYGASDGSITAITSGGTLPYTYSLDNGQHWQDTTIFTQLTASAYRLLIKDTNGCADSTAIQVQSPLPLTLTSTVEQVSCYGAADGRVTLLAQGGTAPYLYSIDGVHWQTENKYKALVPGAYSFLVEDKNGCAQQISIQITEPTPLALKLGAITHACAYAGGQIQVNASGGTLPYHYTITDSSTYNTNGLFKDLAAGSYPVMVTDQHGCTDQLPPVNIAASPALFLNVTAKTDMHCDGIHKGSVTLLADGGAAPYRYELNGNVIGPGHLTGLDNGAYEAMVKDVNGCMASRQFDIILQNEDCELMMPSGFSPNGDGRNDLFRPALYGNIQQYQLQVFNAWGNLIFMSNDPETGWDGAFKGKQQPAGTYVWVARYLDRKGEAKVRRGVVTVVR